MTDPSDPEHFLLEFVNISDHSSRTISGVPPTCSVARVKELLAQIEPGASLDRLRLVFAGRILRDDETVGALGAPGDSRISIVVTGLPARAPSPAAEAPPESPPAPPRLWFGCWIALAIHTFVIAGTLLLIYVDPHPSDFPPTIELTVPMQALVMTFIALVLLAIGGLAFLDYILGRINLEIIRECVRMFFVCMNPFWDVKSFREKYIPTIPLPPPIANDEE